MKTTATLTSKGQITIPKVVRRLLGLHAGDSLEFEVQQGRVEVRPCKPGRTSSGALKPHLPRDWKPLSPAEMDEATANHLARKHRAA